MKNDRKGVLILEDGQEFEGLLFGAPVTADSIVKASKTSGLAKDRGYGEVVFNTSMTGYQEILTDPSYYGQMVCMTTPHIGNTGVNDEDPESQHPWCAGFIVHEMSEEPSNWRSRGSLRAYLEEHGIPGIYGIDTRALTRHLRAQGVVRGVILPLEDRARARDLLEGLPRFEGRDLIGEVTTKKSYRWGKSAAGSGKYKVVAMDFGLKWNLLNSLEHFGCEIEVVPANTSADEILSRKPDGIFLSNGPGDPAAAPYAAKTVRALVGKVPLFGVCMGHQILALAMGAKTYKLKFGHRGGNQPVIDRSTGHVEISSHNHGYAVDGSSLPKEIEVTHINLNDKTVEGLAVPSANAFSVQYHPEACPGPHDSVELFERFVRMMERACTKNI
ncbi:MAG: glutamine-hydrolyzing carbamoyl-phosphate synthase small subunit [Oligoflexia bacterium]|nr:glutamine-hydrolyzing carbamoyl-phosphate synthase small subunit [Oligoflexia bacterium]